jgi:hypothetical protein
VINGGEVELNGVSISLCKGTSGGGIYTTISGTGKLSIKNKCSFTSCTCTSGSGGAIYASLSSTSTSAQGIFISGSTEESKTTFTSCTASNSGGGIFFTIATSATSANQFTITGPVEIKDCNSVN